MGAERDHGCADLVDEGAVGGDGVRPDHHDVRLLREEPNGAVHDEGDRDPGVCELPGSDVALETGPGLRGDDLHVLAVAVRGLDGGEGG